VLQPIKRQSIGFNKRAKGQPKAPLVWRTGLSGVPPDSVRCTTGQCPVHQRTPSQTRHLRENPEALRYNSPDCPVLQGTTPQELASFGNSQRLVRYNSLDMSGVNRSVRCAIEATDTSASTATCSALNTRQRAQKSGTPILAHRCNTHFVIARNNTNRENNFSLCEFNLYASFHVNTIFKNKKKIIN
jgi:hypothetical protein